MDTAPPQPKGPIFGWRSLQGRSHPVQLPHVLQLPATRITTSGRAALWLALAATGASAGAHVLVPTYHCPTMIAPVIAQGLRPLFFPLTDAGLPRLDALESLAAHRPVAIIVPHLFGRAQSLATIRDWCDRAGVMLIEDCAHTFFGMAGERPVGAWGDFATASLTKFLPVPEGGVLASARRPLPSIALERAGPRQQLKALLAVIERRAVRRGGSIIERWRPLRRSAPQGGAEPARPVDPVETMLVASDMGRVGQRPSICTLMLARLSALAPSIDLRQRHFAHFARRLANVEGLRPLWQGDGVGAAPYVYPLWVDRADAVYARLRQRGMAALRWDRIWPGTPCDPADPGTRWSRHVLQLLCHQSLDASEIDTTCDLIAELSQGSAA